MTQHTKISVESVQGATGRTWDEWFEALDGAGADGRTHKEIVTIVRDDLGLDKPWWQQEITVAYERARGMRTLGETASAGFEIGVQRSLPMSQEEAWNLITTPPGRDMWLGSVEQVEWAPGTAYETAEGTRGEIRSVEPGTRVRLTWQPRAWERPSTLQLYLQPRARGTAIRFHHEKLADAEAREEMREHWASVLEHLASLSH